MSDPDPEAALRPVTAPAAAEAELTPPAPLPAAERTPDVAPVTAPDAAPVAFCTVPDAVPVAFCTVPLTADGAEPAGAEEAVELEPVGRVTAGVVVRDVAAVLRAGGRVATVAAVATDGPEPVPVPPAISGAATPAAATIPTTQFRLRMLPPTTP